MSMGNIQKMGYTIKQKIDICLMAEANPEMTQADLANWAKKKYHTIKPPSQTTISRILSKKNELIALKEHEFRLIRRRKPSNVLLREILSEWICQSVWDNIPINTSIIQNSATTLWKILPVNSKEGNGEFSHKWCNHFLSKMNVNLSSLESELVKPNKIWRLSHERIQLKAFLSQFNLKDVFVLDEFFLYYKLPLDKKYINDDLSLGANQVFQNRNGVTVLLTTNADGSEKLEPLLVGHYDNMACFEGKPPTKIASKYEVSYKSNKVAWLTSMMFADWLSTLDKRLSLANRHIVLCLDDAASHRVVNIKLDFIRLVFIQNDNAHGSNSNNNNNHFLGGPLNSNRQKVLPMNSGIFREFKVLYRLQQYLLSLSLQLKLGNQALLNIDQYSVSLIDVMIMVKNAWSNVSVEVIRNAWINADIIDINAYAYQQFNTIDDKNTNSNVNSNEGQRPNWGNTNVQPGSPNAIKDVTTNNHANDNANASANANHINSASQTASLSANTATDFKNSEFKLFQMIKQFAVNEKWDIDTLTSLLFEEKFLNYQTPTEMVNACIVEEYEPNVNNQAPKIATANPKSREPVLQVAIVDGHGTGTSANANENANSGAAIAPPKNEQNNLTLANANPQIKTEGQVQIPSLTTNDANQQLDSIKQEFGNADDENSRFIVEQYDNYFGDYLPDANDFKFSLPINEMDNFGKNNQDMSGNLFFDIGQMDLDNNNNDINNNTKVENNNNNNNNNISNLYTNFNIPDQSSPTNFFNFDGGYQGNQAEQQQQQQQSQQATQQQQYSDNSRLQYNQHVNKYTANSLFSEPVKKGNLSSIVTIPDNSRSFGVLYNKKRKVSSMESSDEQNNTNNNNSYNSNSYHSASKQDTPVSLFGSPLGNAETLSKSDLVNSNSQRQFSSRNSSAVPSPSAYMNMSTIEQTISNFTNPGTSVSTSQNPNINYNSSSNNNNNGTSTNSIVNTWSNVGRNYLTNLTAKKKATLLSAVIQAANLGEFQLSETCIDELRGQLIGQVGLIRQEEEERMEMSNANSNVNNVGNANSNDLNNLTQYLSESLDIGGDGNNSGAGTNNASNIGQTPGSDGPGGSGAGDINREMNYLR